MTPRHDIVPVQLVIKAMRDSGYKNAAYAIAELIDNSIQAGAREVHLLCREKEEFVAQRSRRRIHEIAVLDDGSGMDAATLRLALQYGNGTRLDDRSGIGRFGMGLPNSSMSQCRRVEVWSWQHGPESALFSYLDLDEIAAGRLDEVPAPLLKPIPRLWSEAADRLGTSGTLVVWRQLDRCVWKTAKAVINNSEFLVGRMYRRFIDDGRASIRMASFVDSVVNGYECDRLAKANDPLYLMLNTSCPAPYDNQALFEAFGDSHVIKVSQDGEDHEVRVRFTVAKAEARSGYNPGRRDYGGHANRNAGVSVMRADRELELQEGWLIGYDPVERWWGCEIDFPPALDELFGVTNNKQTARLLADFSMEDTKRIALSEGVGENVEALREQWKQDDDARLVLLELKIFIDQNLRAVRNALKAQTQGNKQARHQDVNPNSPEAKGTAATEGRKRDGYEGRSDAQESAPEEEREADLRRALEDDGVEPTQAHKLARTTVKNRLKFVFGHGSFESSAFFSVKPKGGSIAITLNTGHPAYEHLVALLEEDPDDDDLAALRTRMKRSFDGLKLLLEAWARYEDELPDGRKREMAQDARGDWGKVARDFMRED